MRSHSAGSVLAIDASACGVTLDDEELRSIQGGAFPIIGWIAGAFVVSIMVGMIDSLLFGDCNCKVR